MPDQRLIDRFIAFRKRLFWSRRDISFLVECDEGTIRNLEAGRREFPPGLVEWLAKMASFLRSNPPPKYNEIRAQRDAAE
jgi:hypothetical protein